MLDSKKVIVVGIVTTLILGFILGVIADRALSFGKHGPKYWKWMEKKDSTAKELMEEKLLQRLSRKLDLNQAQVQSIGGILRILSQQTIEENERHHKKMQLTMKETNEKIKPHLSAEQQKKFDKMIEAHRNRWRKFSKKEEGTQENQEQ